MCGIIFIYLHKEEKNIEDVKKGYNMLTNRGPDSGTWLTTNNKIVGFRRLSIMDTESSKGDQPFILPNGDMLLCNGEIFNHKELISKYKLECVSTSDCECIIHLYHKIGFESMLKELNGDFAIIIFTKNKILFARDRIGVRPLFYGFTRSGNFALASYARSLLGFCENVNSVSPGWGEYIPSSNSLIFSEYTTASVPQKISEKKVKDVLIESVKSRLMSERPIGCLLSGGLDSSLIASILCKLLGPENVRTYSIGMKGSQDLKFANVVSKYLGTKHTEVIFTPEEGFDAIPSVIRDLESYDITTVRASVGMWLLAKYISENTDDIVLFSGEGADELFCGYLYFHYAPTLEELSAERKSLIKNLHFYDVLRADRCISSHGLELRVPFLDPYLLDLTNSLSPEIIAPSNGYEKHLIRELFSNGDYLPESVLWRRKDGMSDGVSGDTSKKWFEQIQEYTNLKVSDKEFEIYKENFPTKEAYYYKKIFREFFPEYNPTFPYWLPKWIECNGNPSGRILGVFDKK
jgi:asparagine synthase (glutamine-hydrolysing)